MKIERTTQKKSHWLFIFLFCIANILTLANQSSIVTCTIDPDVRESGIDIVVLNLSQDSTTAYTVPCRLKVSICTKQRGYSDDLHRIPPTAADDYRGSEKKVTPADRHIDSVDLHRRPKTESDLHRSSEAQASRHQSCGVQQSPQSKNANKGDLRQRSSSVLHRLRKLHQPKENRRSTLDSGRRSSVEKQASLRGANPTTKRDCSREPQRHSRRNQRKRYPPRSPQSAAPTQGPALTQQASEKHTIYPHQQRECRKTCSQPELKSRCGDKLHARSPRQNQEKRVHRTENLHQHSEESPPTGARPSIPERITPITHTNKYRGRNATSHLETCGEGNSTSAECIRVNTTSPRKSKESQDLQGANPTPQRDRNPSVIDLQVKPE